MDCKREGRAVRKNLTEKGTEGGDERAPVCCGARLIFLPYSWGCLSYEVKAHCA